LSASAIVTSSSEDGEHADDNEDEHKLTDIESVCSAHHTGDLRHKAVVDDISPRVVRTKHQLQDSDEETKPLKFHKASDRSRQRLKAGDFDKVTQDLLAIAVSIYRCLVVTREPFPQTLISETLLAKEAWREASKLAELTIQLTPSLVKLVRSHLVMSSCLSY
jgi:hypothetical protein